MSVEMVIIGMGNTMLGDDGVGIAVMNQIRKNHSKVADFKDVQLGGLDVVAGMLSYKRAVVIDSVVTGEREVGSFYELDEKSLAPSDFSSVHVLDLGSALNMARESGVAVPKEIKFYVMEVGNRLEFGDGLSDAVRNKVDAMAEAIVSDLVECNWINEEE